jgi:hypothetical protein
LNLNGHPSILSLSDFLNDETSDTAFILVRTVKCSAASILMAHTGVSQPSTEKIYLKCRLLKEVMHKFVMCHFHAERRCPPQSVCPSTGIAPLKLFLFHYRSVLQKYTKDHPTAKAQIGGLLRYSEMRFGKEFEEAEDLLARGLVSQAHISKLYRPNSLVVSKMNGQPSAFVVHDWPHVDQHNCITVKCWSYQTDGSGFARKLTVFSIGPIEMGYPTLSSLIVYPIRYATPEVREMVRVNWRKR